MGYIPMEYMYAVMALPYLVKPLRYRLPFRLTRLLPSPHTLSLQPKRAVLPANYCS